MLPYIQIYILRFSTFPLIEILAIISCFSVIKNNRRKYLSVTHFLLRKHVLTSIVFMAMGGKLLFFLTSLQEKMELWRHFAGFVFYGGLAGAMIGLYISTQKTGESFGNYVDLVLSILPLGQAIGRIGCYFNGCCYGRVTNSAFAVIYPVEDHMKMVYPTWFMESILCMGLLLVLQLGVRTARRWVHTSIYCIGYGLIRIFVEFFRGDDIRGTYGFFSTSQWISIIVVIFGIICYVKTKSLISRNYLIEGYLWKKAD